MLGLLIILQEMENWQIMPQYINCCSFQAFRFPSTPTVNFVATVQFCQELCDPSPCQGELQSYGRKRRSVIGENVTSSHDLLPDQLMLGLRLTVGEDQVARPQPPSRLGRGNFPERDLGSGGGTPGKEEYYPGLPQISTLGEMKIIILELNFQYRQGLV